MLDWYKKDSLYISQAIVRYAPRNLEVYDCFDHDFILHTQETESALNNIPNVRLGLKNTDLKRGKIALDIDGCPILVFHLSRENGVIQIETIDGVRSDE